MSRANDYVAAFERGEDFTPPSEGLTLGDRPDPSALLVLREALREGAPEVRENVVALLVDVGLRTDPRTPAGAETLSSDEIVDALAGEGLAAPDVGREAAMDALRKLVPASALARHGDAFTRALEEAPSDDAFLLVAKAKPSGARPVVVRQAALADWKATESARIARAALGDAAIEQEFLTAASEADASGDGSRAAAALGSLALIGTERSLKALAGYLRTPLTIHIPGAFEKSVRLNVLEGLLYAFPDQPVLYPNNIVTDDDYGAAEEFCTRTLGVQYDAPRPAFLTYRGYPVPARGN